METARDFALRLRDLLRRERLALADFLSALAEFDAAKAWRELGYTSLFYFLHRELGLSKGAAFYRKTAAELIQRYPEVAEALRDGRLCLTTIVELSKIIRPENRAEVLPRFFQLSKAEAKEVAVEIDPAQSVPHRDVVTTVRAPAAPPLALELPAGADPGKSVHPANLTASKPPPPPSASPVRVEPLTAQKTRVHFTASRKFLKKLDAARDALSHSHPSAGIEEILEAGLDLLLEREAKRKGLVKKPRAVPPPSSDPDHVPAHVRRAVWERDGGKCQFRLPNGEICGSRHQLEIDHVIPRAAGGPSTIENCRLTCRGHNQLAARRFFGDVAMDRYARPRGPAAPRRSTSPP